MNFFRALHAETDVFRSCPHQAASRMTGHELLEAVMRRREQRFGVDASAF
jgi:hypothetical protein